MRSQSKNDSTPWINLDETDQITLNNMYAGAAPAHDPGNSAPQLIRFLAKSNRVQYVYVASNSDPDPGFQHAHWWSTIPESVVAETRKYLIDNKASPPPNSSTMVSQPNGTIEVKAGWRPLTSQEMGSGHFHTQRVRYYESDPVRHSICYRDAIWGLVALHIIQKTPSAPYFIYATFEQSDNILTAAGDPVEDQNGVVVHRQSTATTPQVCLQDRRPTGPGAPVPSANGSVVITTNPFICNLATDAYCTTPGNRLYYHNAKPPPYLSGHGEPDDGNICVNQRINRIPAEIVAANVEAHEAIRLETQQHGNPMGEPWAHYKLVNVQYFPYDKVISALTPDGSLYTGSPPYSAQHPSPSSYYQANIVVETNRSLQQFSGGLSPQIATDWNKDSSQHKNTYYAGAHYNMGGCMGCHGSQGQNPELRPSGDFSVILSRGAVIYPEVPESAEESQKAHRNRSLSQ